MSESIDYIRLNDVEKGRIDDPIEATALTVVYNSMQVVRGGMQLKNFLRSMTRYKADGTFLTEYDERSEACAAEIMADMAPGMRFRGEEGTRSGQGSKELGLDPLDGTRNFVVGGGGATVIAAVYNSDKTIYGAAIGQPSTGIVYSAFGDSSTTGRLIKRQQQVGTLGIGHTTTMHHDVRTWKGGFAERGQVFIDSTKPFAPDGHERFTKEQHLGLRAALWSQDIETMGLASNGAHQLSVASGSERAAGAITLARGVPEDTTAGLFLTERSGGATQRFTARDGVITPVENGFWDYDLAIAACSDAVGNFLTERLLELSH